MLKKYKHISFDLDGTLVHTLPAYRYKTVSEVLRRLGGKIKEERDIDRFWLEANRDAIIEKYFSVGVEDFWKVFRQVDNEEERAAQTFAYEDAEDCLIKLKQMGKIISVITGAPEKIARLEQKKLKSAPIDHFFSLDYNVHGEKPDPRGFLSVLDKLGVKPEETVYIGNSNEDAYFSKNAGVDFIYLERQQHEFDSKDWIIKTIHSLEELIK